jgi:DNA-binding response OmpR family regulator
MKGILVVGPDADMIKMITDVLVMEGFKVSSIASFSDIIQVAMETQPDLIILDDSGTNHQMIYFLQQWQSSHSLNAIPLLLLTPNQREELKLRAIDRTVKKPGSLESLLRVVTGVFNA